jgi:hypothetical protein
MDELVYRTYDTIHPVHKLLGLIVPKDTHYKAVCGRHPVQPPNHVKHSYYRV